MGVTEQTGELDAETLRADFPTLQREVNDRRIAYLDNAATAQKPQQVIDAISDYYENSNANVHRCIHTLAEEATEAYDAAHETVAEFIGADWDEVVFTKNATEASNLVAHAYGMNNLSDGDEILLTAMEHHSMIVPWQQVAEKTGATIRYVDVTEDGELDMDDLTAKVSDKTAVVGVVHASNVLGTVNPVQEIAEIAHEHDAVCIVDGAQSVPHMPIDVEDIGCDFLFFSGHKMLGPTGIGALYGREELLEEMDPFLYGGDMISRVSEDTAEWSSLPWKFEAGTPNVSGAIGLATAVEYLENIGMERIEQHGRTLARDTYDHLADMEHVTVYGPDDRMGLVAFTVENAHPHDLSSLLNEDGIAIRGGHHCAQPLSKRLGVGSTARASYYLYNTREDMERLETAVKKATGLFN